MQQSIKYRKKIDKVRKKKKRELDLLDPEEWQAQREADKVRKREKRKVNEDHPTKHQAQKDVDRGRKRKERRLVLLDQPTHDTQNECVKEPSLIESIAKAVKQAKGYLRCTKLVMMVYRIERMCA